MLKTLFFASLLFFSAFAQAAAPTPPSIQARAWLLADLSSGQILVSENSEERFEPASLTKLMTAYVVFSALREKTITLEQQANISERAWKAPGSRMFIEPRKPATIDQLIRGMVVQSGNDASIALAEAVSGSEEVFVSRMNQEAARLGLKDTKFMNASGLPDPQHLTTARDLRALLLAERVPLQQHYAAQPQPAAMARSERRRREDRPHGSGGLLPDRFFTPRRAAHAVRAARCVLGGGARTGIAQASELGVSSLRQRQALCQGQGREDDPGLEG